MAESRIVPTSFLSYAPVPLAFGTSGLRGLVTDITDLEAYINVKAALRYLSSVGDISPRSGVVIAGDLRPSTDRIMRACAQAIIDLSCQVENAGIGSALMRHAVAEAARLGHGAILLVGDAPYYGRFGFSAAKTGAASAARTTLNRLGIRMPR